MTGRRPDPTAHILFLIFGKALLAQRPVLSPRCAGTLAPGEGSPSAASSAGDEEEEAPGAGLGSGASNMLSTGSSRQPCFSCTGSGGIAGQCADVEWGASVRALVRASRETEAYTQLVMAGTQCWLRTAAPTVPSMGSTEQVPSL